MSPRQALIVGNWKMHRTLAQAVGLAHELRTALAELRRVQLAACPSFTLLSAVGKVLAGSNIALGGQDCFWEAQGAFTGEVSPTQLVDAGCRLVILGHSERRRQRGETSAEVDRKVRAALLAGLTPIVCVGESLEERRANQAFQIVNTQVEESIGGLSPADASRLVLAYEPVWAIGTGRNASADQAQEVHAAIRAQLATLFGSQVALEVQVLYGGSVKVGNADELLAEPDVDGALVGGASLSADEFAAIARAACG